MTYPCLWFSLLTAGCFCKVTVETGRGSKDSSLSVACLCIRMSHLYGLEVLTCKNKHYKRKVLRVRRVQQSLFCHHQMRGLTVGRSLKCQFSWRMFYDSLFWTRIQYSHLQNAAKQSSLFSISFSQLEGYKSWFLSHSNIHHLQVSNSLCNHPVSTLKIKQKKLWMQCPALIPLLHRLDPCTDLSGKPSPTLSPGWIQPSASVPQFPTSQGK